LLLIETGSYSNSGCSSFLTLLSEITERIGWGTDRVMQSRLTRALARL
jgi:hypothetical protein